MFRIWPSILTQVHNNRSLVGGSVGRWSVVLIKPNKCKLKFKSKPWITLSLQKSISVKKKLLTNFINKKDPILKEEFTLNTKNIEIHSPPL